MNRGKMIERVRSERVPRMKGLSVEVFAGLAGSYDRTLDLATLLQDRYWKRWVVEKALDREGGLVLDVGSGTLVLEERLASRRVSVIGVDLSKRMVQVGKKKRLENVSLLVNGDAEALPFRDGAFDAVVSCYVAKYVSLSKFAGELARVLKPGGRIATYDFVTPRGPLFPFLAVYIYGFMRMAGFLLGLAKRESAFTFENIPGIVEGANWDKRVAGLMEINGIQTRAFDRLSGGVVSAYCGVKNAVRHAPAIS